jgi:hypothetical protein
MTLFEWHARTGIDVYPHNDGVYYTTQDLNRSIKDSNCGAWEAYHLTDYVVSSVNGIVTWFTPITKGE